MEQVQKIINGNLLLYSGSYNFDNEKNLFQVNNNFFYLTNIDIPNLVILYNSKIKKFIYFFKFEDSIWFDNNNLLQKINKKNKILDISDISKHTKNMKQIYSLDNIKELPVKININCDIKVIDNICNELRVIKNNFETHNIARACEITGNAIMYVIKNIQKYNNEENVITEFKKQILNSGVEKMAYLPICSNGKNNSILHYVYNKNKIYQNNLVLLDIGCKYNNYCSDITRTFPKSGKFTLKQKKIYSIVLECQKYAINKLREGIDWIELEQEVRLLMYELLLSINLVFSTNTTSNKINITRKFMPHSLGHTIGLDVHDTKPQGKLKILKKNMVITIEPGIYFISDLLNTNKFINMNEIKKYINIGGIRIEDTILINKYGCRVLSNIPKEINELEKLIQTKK